MKKLSLKKLATRARSYFRPSTRMADIAIDLPGRIMRPARPETVHASEPAQPEPKKKEKLKPLSKKWLVVAIILALLCSGTIIVAGSKVFAGNSAVEPVGDHTQYEGILTAEEITEWTNRKQQKGKAYVQINTRIQVDHTGKANLRLINPPYSSYAVDMELRLTEDDSVLYSIDDMRPGSIEQFTTIDSLLTGDHNAVAVFTFYNKEGKQKGDYKLDLVIDVQNEEIDYDDEDNSYFHSNFSTLKEKDGTMVEDNDGESDGSVENSSEGGDAQTENTANPTSTDDSTTTPPQTTGDTTTPPATQDQPSFAI